MEDGSDQASEFLYFTKINGLFVFFFFLPTPKGIRIFHRTQRHGLGTGTCRNIPV